MRWECDVCRGVYPQGEIEGMPMERLSFVRCLNCWEIAGLGGLTIRCSACWDILRGGHDEDGEIDTELECRGCGRVVP